MILETAVFLSKNGTDPYINSIAASIGVAPTVELDYSSSRDPIFMRSILKHKLMNRCKEDGRDFYYVDTGYFGNHVSTINPQGAKLWHRIVLNDLQHTGMSIFPGDRLQKTGVKIKPWTNSGSKILIAAPDEKPCKHYGIQLDEWIDTTISTIRQYTDRPIEVRQRSKNRSNRVISNTFEQALTDVFAVVTYNSAAGVEAVLNGVPAFVLAPSHAAQAVAKTNLAEIENPFRPNWVYEWACYLSYCQFHVQELKSGYAINMLREYDKIYRNTSK